MNTLTAQDFARHFGIAPSDLPSTCLELIAAGDFRHEILTGAAHDRVMDHVRDTLRMPLDISGPHRLGKWEAGWGENLREFIASGYDTATLIPKFVKKDVPVRLEGHYAATPDGRFETDYVKVLRAWLFHKYFVEPQAIYEFGAGTGHNLVQAAQTFPHKSLVGCDWAEASIAIIDLLRTHLGLKISGQLFDLFSPYWIFNMAPRAGVLTIGTLEQTGANFGTFVNFLCAQRPSICVHVETIYELYNQAEPFDWVAAAYLEKRGYLKGFLPALQELERKGRAKIIEVRRTFGSYFHDGYSYVVWKPV